MNSHRLVSSRVTSSYLLERGKLKVFNLLGLTFLLILIGITVLFFSREHGIKACGIILLSLGGTGLLVISLHAFKGCLHCHGSNGRTPVSGEDAPNADFSSGRCNRGAGCTARVNAGYEGDARVCYIVMGVTPGVSNGERNSCENGEHSPSVPDYEHPPSYEEATASVPSTHSKVQFAAFP